MINGIYAGVDIGSVFCKAVIVKQEQILAYHIMPSGANYKLVADETLKEALNKAGLSANDIAYIVATGYGASSLPFANEVVTDITCQGMGIVHLFPSVRTVIDVGGQFSRVLNVDEAGKTKRFIVSDKCAAGSGRFLQVIAKVLQIDFDDIGQLSLKSKKRVDFNTGCAVFAETEAVARIAEGDSKEDILAGVHRALAASIANLVERIKLEPECAVVGGGAKDIGLVKSLEETLGLSLLIPTEPQIIAAFGAASIAGKKQRTN